jgi:hypothetical protein
LFFASSKYGAKSTSEYFCLLKSVCSCEVWKQKFPLLTFIYLFFIILIFFKMWFHSFSYKLSWIDNFVAFPLQNNIMLCALHISNCSQGSTV